MAVRQETLARASNNNAPGATPSLWSAWDAYYAAATARWVGRIEPNDADEAIQAAAVTFRESPCGAER